MRVQILSFGLVGVLVRFKNIFRRLFVLPMKTYFDSVCKPSGIRDARNFSFHPKQIGIRRICFSSLYTVLNSRLCLVVSFSHTTFIPIKINLKSRMVRVNEFDIIDLPITLGSYRVSFTKNIVSNSSRSGITE